MIPAKSLQKDTLQQITAKIRQASTVDENKARRDRPTLARFEIIREQMK